MVHFHSHAPIHVLESHLFSFCTRQIKEPCEQEQRKKEKKVSQRWPLTMRCLCQVLSCASGVAYKPCTKNRVRRVRPPTPRHKDAKRRRKEEGRWVRWKERKSCHPPPVMFLSSFVKEKNWGDDPSFQPFVVGYMPLVESKDNERRTWPAHGTEIRLWQASWRMTDDDGWQRRLCRPRQPVWTPSVDQGRSHGRPRRTCCRGWPSWLATLAT